MYYKHYYDGEADHFRFMYIMYIVIAITLLIVTIVFSANYNEDINNKLNSGQISEQEYCQKYKDDNTRYTPNRCLKYFLPQNK